MSSTSLYLVAFLTIGLLACSEKKDCIGENYYTKVITDSSEITDRRVREQRFIEKDKLYIFFQRGFESDTIDVFVNKKFNQTTHCTTNKSIESCGGFTLDNISSISEISFRKNCGSLLKVPIIENQGNIIALDFREDTLKATIMVYPNIYE